ncbi:SDR family NAD(P)-dependent oxidoreductase [Streptomyces sp. NPDC027717]|uniref:SDR family NAD(P)-dependent oxidoreductase n=1 Tax=Streptomyces sp. NPDC027717 TaxID=3155765 RepID=UPI0033CCAA3B
MNAKQRGPIAICSMACRFPGASTPEELWDILREGRHVASALPKDRGWEPYLYDEDKDMPGKTYVRAGGFLEDVAGFDAGFFGVGPREAAAMDPAQRLMLEVAWEACERARLDPVSFRGTPMGVYIGSFTSGYLQTSDAAALGGYGATGTAMALVAGRVSYSLGLLGPALVVDTSCSSSLAALHLAVRALQDGECDTALVGGAMIIAGTRLLTDFSRQRALAADGKSKAFAQGADGFCPAEGVGALVLMPLARARERDLPVLGVVSGSALNEDGASPGVAVPSESAQRAVIEAALRDAGLSGRDIDLVEAHGTGTAVGDPIEARSLMSVYGADRGDEPLWIGSLKSNVGHMQAASGLGGIIKVLLAMSHEVMPRTLHVEEPTTAVDWDAGSLRLLAQERAWPVVAGKTRRAGVLGYGISGTNAHVLLEEAAPTPPPAASGREGEIWAVPGPVVWPLSAKTPAALQGQAARLVSHIEGQDDPDPRSIAWSLATTRSVFEHRARVVAKDLPTLLEATRCLAQGRDAAQLMTAAKPVFPGAQPETSVWVFPGQGAQWQGMGAALLDQSPHFAASMKRCARALAPYVEWDLLETVSGRGPVADLARVDVVQPALFALYVSLAEMWRAHGLTPGAVIGHSQGEIAAACVSGALSLDDAARIVALRSQALRAVEGQGAMVSVPLGEQECAALLRRCDDSLQIAVVNSPGATVVSGPDEALAAFVGVCEQEKVRAVVLPVSYASHSAAVDVARDRVIGDLSEIRPRPGEVPMYSSMTGGVIVGDDLDADYWFESLRRPVRFQNAIEEALTDGRDAFLEVSPHPVLLAAIADTAQEAGADITLLGTLKRDEGDDLAFARAVADAHLAGLTVNWAPFSPGARVQDLPTYAFEHRPYWIGDARHGGPDETAGGLDTLEHPFLTTQVELPDGSRVLTGELSLNRNPWLSGHALYDATIVPGTAMVEMMLQAAGLADCEGLEDVSLHAPIPLADTTRTAIRVTLGLPNSTGKHPVALHSRPHDAAPGTAWTEHATSTATPTTATQAPAPTAWPPPEAQPVPLYDFYAEQARRGYHYGPAFRCVQAAWRHEDRVYAEIAFDASPTDTSGQGPASASAETGFAIHPALLDAALHPLLLYVSDKQARMPYAIASVRLFKSGATRLRVTLPASFPERFTITVADDSGETVLVLEDIDARPAPPELLQQALVGTGIGHKVVWEPLASSTAGPDTIDTAAPLPDLAAAHAAVAAGEPAPDIILLDCRRPATSAPEGTQRQLLPLDSPDEIDAQLRTLLAHLQDFLSDDLLASRLLVLMRGAQLTGAETAAGPSLDPSQAAAWGMVRSAISEHPGRVQLVDTDTDTDTDTGFDAALLHTILDAGAPETAVRAGHLLTPRLKPTSKDLQVLPAGDRHWRFRPTGQGAPDYLRLHQADDLTRPLGDNEVRLRVRAAGMIFRDVLICLGVLDSSDCGFEVAGVVEETGPGVTRFAPGDRVAGVVPSLDSAGCWASGATLDEDRLAKIPDQWSFPLAAGVPIAFSTARYGLLDLASLTAGDKVLIHSAAGGVGMAAIQVAAAAGAELYATASPEKWPLLQSLGVKAENIAHSRTTDFETLLREASGGTGMDVILGSLSGEAVDASLRLLAPGGRYVEMGKTDVRDPEEVQARYPGTTYRVMEAALDTRWEELLPLFDAGTFTLLPVTCQDIRAVRIAVRRFAEGHHTGKNVLTVPQPLNPEGTVLITGGTGTLSALLAHHLVDHHHVRHFLLCSRSGPNAPRANELRTALTHKGATVTIASCDIADRDAVASLLDTVPTDHPLTAVIHTSAVLRNNLLDTMTDTQLHDVLAPKAFGALHLHELTRHLPLAAFILYSSLGGHLGNPGQANYAAANAYLDALAQHRTAQGLPATSFAWGLWSEARGGLSEISDNDIDRIIHLGMRPFSSQEGLAAFDEVLRTGQTVVVATGIGSKRTSPSMEPHHLAAALVSESGHTRTTRRTQQIAAPTRSDLTTLTPEERHSRLLSLVRSLVAAVLGHEDADSIPPDRPLQNLGLDSLGATQLRARLSSSTGLRVTPKAVSGDITPTELTTALAALTTSTGATPTAANPPAQSLTEHTINAWNQGNRGEAYRLIFDAGRQRPLYQDRSEAPPLPVHHLAGDPNLPTLICLPAFHLLNSRQQYQQLATHLQDATSTWTLDLPGFTEDTPAPATRELLGTALAAAVLRIAEGKPFALLGHSAGGWVAHSVAEHLQQLHAPLTALLLLDSHPPTSVPGNLGETMIDLMLGNITEAVDHADNALSAIPLYKSLFDGWAPTELHCPTLLLTAADEATPPHWTTPHGFIEPVSVPGNHFSIIGPHAPTTANAIKTWLNEGKDSE